MSYRPVVKATVFQFSNGTKERGNDKLLFNGYNFSFTKRREFWKLAEQQCEHNNTSEIVYLKMI